MSDPFKILLDAAVAEVTQKHTYILEAALRQAFYDGVAFELKRQSSIRSALLKEMTNESPEKVSESVVPFPASRRTQEATTSAPEAGVWAGDNPLQDAD